MTVNFSDNTSSLPECWADRARETWPVEQYHSVPTAVAYDAEEVARDATRLPRALVAAENRLDALKRVVLTFDDHVALRTDAAAWLRPRLPDVAEARVALERLTEALGADGWIHDTTMPAFPGTARLTLANCGERVAAAEYEVARIRAAWSPERGRRSA